MSPSARNRPRVLVVERNEDMRELVRFALTITGLDVSEATSGAEVLALLATPDPDGAVPNLIVVQLELPDMPGSTLVTKLRARGAWMPVVIIGRDARQFRSAMAEMGVIATFDTPFDIDDFRAEVLGAATLPSR
ncbi:MAG TPA: response regulator [Polyangiaceae bacterium]|jgi:two-component system response regulator MprA